MQEVDVIEHTNVKCRVLTSMQDEDIIEYIDAKCHVFTLMLNMATIL